jgi:putative endonuclease
MPFFAYLLRCSDGTLYAGWTPDLDRRIQVHNAGRGAKYTRCRLPVTLAASWPFDTQTEAMRWEYRLKQLSRTQKEQLVNQVSPESLVDPTDTLE